MLLGASPRGSLALVLTARAHAVIEGRDYVVPEDVKAVAVAALAHRITLRPEVWMRDVSTADIVATALAQVPTPARRRHARPSPGDRSGTRASRWCAAPPPRRRCPLGGVALHRPVLVALGLPLLIWLALQIIRPGDGSCARRCGARRSSCEDQADRHPASGSTHRATDFLTASFLAGEWLAAIGPAEAVTAPDHARPTAPSSRWPRGAGRAPASGRCGIMAWAGTGLFWCAARRAGRAVKIVPYRERFSVSDALPVTSGIVGTHRSRRPGEGTDLAGVRAFQVGDRLRRINWPVSLRTGTLHVTATATDLDADGDDRDRQLDRSRAGR